MNDPSTGNPVNFIFTTNDFTEVEPEKAMNMFKVCAYNLPELTSQQSIKYQVLSDTTAMIGVVKQERQGGELKEIDTIQFGMGVVKTPEPEPWPYYEEEDIAYKTTTSGGGGAPPPSPSYSYPSAVAYDMDYDMVLESEEMDDGYWGGGSAAKSSNEPPPVVATFDTLIAS